MATTLAATKIVADTQRIAELVRKLSDAHDQLIIEAARLRDDIAESDLDGMTIESGADLQHRLEWIAQDMVLPLGTTEMHDLRTQVEELVAVARFHAERSAAA